MLAVGMLLLYLLAGCVIMRCQLPCKRPVVRLWLGCSLGILLLMWLPAIFAFFFRFSEIAHLYAVGALAALMVLAWLFRDRQPTARWGREDSNIVVLWLCVVLPLVVLGGWLQHTHVLRPEEGTLHVGQATYGDLNLHLGIATSLRNAAFPPEYSILPGVQLSYPFLGDSLSTSLLLFGLPLRWAIIVPGTLMMALVFTGYLLLARSVLGKRNWLVILAMLLFFINGGLGFLYDFDMAGRDFSRIQEIFSGFYKTPANQPDFNLRWSNVIVDLMLPQRTLLAGWTLLLPALYLLHSAILTRKLRQFFCTAVFAAALPLVHTHSFLALGLCSAGWMICALVQPRNRDIPEHVVLTRRMWQILGFLLFVAAALTAEPWPKVALGICAAGWLFCALLLARNTTMRWVMLVGCGLCAALAVLFALDSAPKPLPVTPLTFCLASGALCLLLQALGRNAWWQPLPEHDADNRRRVLAGGALYLFITLVLALPQLLKFAVPQTLEGGSLRIQLNWVNNSRNLGMIDGYLWFWIKNVGPAFLLLLCAMLDADRRRAALASGAFAIYLVAEIVLFQPNEYDNNKLLYVWYMIGALLVADYVGVIWERLEGLRGRYVLAAGFVILSVTSGGLSIAREVVSDYQLFSEDAVACAEFAEKETPAEAVFITGESHVNPVAALAGRRIVCGPDLYLYFHGLDYAENNKDCVRFYNDPANNLDVLEKYGVDYILLGDNEYGEYEVDKTAFDALFTPVFVQGMYTVYSTARDAEMPAGPTTIPWSAVEEMWPASTEEPSAQPTQKATAQPTQEPTPTAQPTQEATPQPTQVPTVAPNLEPGSLFAPWPSNP